MYPASRESVAFGDQAMMRSAHAVPNNFVRSSKQTCFPNRVYNMPINRFVQTLAVFDLSLVLQKLSLTYTTMGYRTSWNLYL
jgi:hypothetical protein